MLGVAFDGLYHVGDKVHSALILDFDFGPSLVDVLLERHHRVVGAFAAYKEYDDEDSNDC